MMHSPIPFLLLLLLLRGRGDTTGLRLPSLSPLALESLLDQARTCLHAVDKLSSFARAGADGTLPDMKKVMEIVENLPL